jgi:hypothetical protein
LLRAPLRSPRLRVEAPDSLEPRLYGKHRVTAPNDSLHADEWAASPRRWMLYAAVGLVAGAVIALQIGIMRVFSVGSWAHFGSLVVSLAMLGFGLTSAVMCVAKGWFERHWQGVITGALCAFGPLVIAANLAAQQLPFNAIFLISDPLQKWKLFANFLLYLLPFLAGATFLGRCSCARSACSAAFISPTSPARVCVACCSWARCSCCRRTTWWSCRCCWRGWVPCCGSAGSRARAWPRLQH